VGLSHICFGMAYTQMSSPVWEIVHMSKAVSNPYLYDARDAEIIPGKLQLYYAKVNDDNYQRAARFMPNDDEKATIMFSNFNYATYKEFFEDNLNCQNLSIPIYVAKSKQWGELTQYLEIKKFEKINESEELLDYPRFNVWVRGDTISLYNDQKQIILHDQKNIRQIRQALSRDMQFMIQFHDQLHGNSTGKVTSYENGAYIWWDVEMSIDLSIGDPFIIPIDLNKEKEELHHYSRNKFMRGVLAAAILAAFYYNKSNC